MAYTTNWSVLDMKRELADGYVYEVILQISAVDDDNDSKIFAMNQSIRLFRPEVLTPYSDLTESQIIAWCKTIMADSSVDLDTNGLQWVENTIKQQMEDGISQGVPWT